MDQEPLVREEIDAGAEFLRAFDQYAPVKAAFWLKVGDEGNRHLYIASERIDDTNFVLAYREVIRLANQMPSIYFDPFRVKVLNADKPLARAAAEINECFPNRLGTRIGGGMFGGVFVDQAYIYPSPLPAAV